MHSNCFLHFTFKSNISLIERLRLNNPTVPRIFYRVTFNLNYKIMASYTIYLFPIPLSKMALSNISTCILSTWCLLFLRIPICLLSSMFFAFKIIVFLINHLPTHSLYFALPFQVHYGSSRNYSFLRVFNYCCCPYLHPYVTNKLEFWSRLCIFLGYPSKTVMGIIVLTLFLARFSTLALCLISKISHLWLRWLMWLLCKALLKYPWWLPHWRVLHPPCSLHLSSHNQLPMSVASPLSGVRQLMWLIMLYQLFLCLIAQRFPLNGLIEWLLEHKMFHYHYDTFPLPGTLSAFSVMADAHGPRSFSITQNDYCWAWATAINEYKALLDNHTLDLAPPPDQKIINSK